MKPVAALLSLVLLAPPLRAAAQQPSSVYDLKGPIRDYVIDANAIIRGLCDEALEARDEASLQKILDEVDAMFRNQAAETVALLQKVRSERQLLDSMTGLTIRFSESLVRQQEADLVAAKRKYGQALARSTVLEQMRERVRGCVGIAVNSLRQPGVTAGTGAGGGTSQRAELCQSQAGPLGCTGRFSGTYQIECGDGSGLKSQDAGPGSVTFSSDGTVALQLQGGTTSLTGRIDSSGRVSIVESEGGFSQRWDGRFSVQPAPGGGSRAVGGGTYQSRVTGPQGQLNNECHATFQLPGAPL